MRYQNDTFFTWYLGGRNNICSFYCDMVSLPEVMAYLFNRYGTEAMVIATMVGELLHLPFPKDSAQEEINLAKISSLTSICDTEGDLCLFTMDKIKTVVWKTVNVFYFLALGFFHAFLKLLFGPKTNIFKLYLWWFNF